MILKSLIRYTNGIAIEATWVDENDQPVKCRAYDGSQMAELRAELGEDAAEYESLIAQCEAEYVPTVVMLEELKAAKNAEINQSRATANTGTFIHFGRTFSCDQLSRGDIDGVNGEVALTGALPADFPGAWKAVDNSYFMIPDVATWTQFYQSMVAAGTANFLHAQQLKTQLAAATTAEEVAAIVW